jgi:hypothetical protein
MSYPGTIVLVGNQKQSFPMVMMSGFIFESSGQPSVLNGSLLWHLEFQFPLPDWENKSGPSLTQIQNHLWHLKLAKEVCQKAEPI